MNKEMLKYMVKYDVPIITVSDAHVPKNVGMLISEMNKTVVNALEEV